MSDARSWHARLGDFEASLATSGETFHIGLERGTMTAGLYRPAGEDLQTPHARDEVYIIRRGSAEFVRDGDRVKVAEGDVLFVPANMEHRFVAFSEDFDTWVLFWGPEGGEN